MNEYKPIFIVGLDLDDTWFRLLWSLFEYGRQYKIDEGSYAGQHRLSFDFVSGFIKHPYKRPLTPRVPETSNLPPVTTDEEIEQYFTNYLMNGELGINEDYKYATWIVGGRYQLPKAEIFIDEPGKNEGMIWEDAPYIKAPNQLQWVIDHFKEKGLGNNHCYIQIGYPESNYAYDVPYQDEIERRTSPCLRGIDFKTIDKKWLMLHVYFRSWDLISGWPTNMGGLQLLNEYVAEELKISPGPLAFSCKDLHAYNHSMGYLKTRLNKG